MTWIAGVVERIKGRQPTDWMFVEGLPDPGLGIAGKPIEPDECYIEIYIESLRLKQARRFATEFHGLVYSFARMSLEGDGDAHLAAISKPDNLANLDAANLDKVITVSSRMIGAVPWRGGTLGLELGLFSVKKGNLLSPLLNYVARVSEVGGIGFIGQVKPFLPLITEGMDLIAGQTADSVIEVAVDIDLSLRESRLFAVLAVPSDRIDRTKLTVDPNDRKLLLEGQPLAEAYCVFSIRRTDQKADFGAIPDVKATWAELQGAIKSNDRARADTALAAFRRTVIASPDLIPTDGARLVAKAQQKVDSAFPRGFAPVSQGKKKGPDIGPLESVQLYG